MQNGIHQISCYSDMYFDNYNWKSLVFLKYIVHLKSNAMGIKSPAKCSELFGNQTIEVLLLKREHTINCQLCWEFHQKENGMNYTSMVQL